MKHFSFKFKHFTLSTALLLLVAGLSIAVAQRGEFSAFGRGGGHLMGGFFSGLLSLLLLVLLILSIVYLGQLLRSRGTFAGFGVAPSPVPTVHADSSGLDSALSILRERLAKGEIEVGIRGKGARFFRWSKPRGTYQLNQCFRRSSRVARLASGTLEVSSALKRTRFSVARSFCGNCKRSTCVRQKIQSEAFVIGPKMALCYEG